MSTLWVGGVVDSSHLESKMDIGAIIGWFTMIVGGSKGVIGSIGPW